MATINRIPKFLSPSLWGGWVGLLISFSGCISDPIYNTDHPEKAKVTIKTVWNDRGEGIDIPDSYLITSGTIQEEAKSDLHTLTTLMEPGNREFILYNRITQIPVTDGVAKVNMDPNPCADGTLRIDPLPDCLFTGTVTSQLEKDNEYTLTATMHQQVRQLTILLTPHGSAAGEIVSIEGNLTGAAGELDLSSTVHSVPSEVSLPFTLITEGTDAAKWETTVRLLGIAGEKQMLTVMVSLIGQETVIPIEINLTEDLSGFNADKKSPLIVNNRFHIETPPGPEPEKTRVTFVTDWSDRGIDVTISSAYIISTTGVEEIATGENYTMNKRFEAGTYPFYLYNKVPEIVVTGGIAKVNTVEGAYIHTNPGWFFTGFTEVTLQQEAHHQERVLMHQQIRQFTILLVPDGNAAGNITSIKGTLTGIAGEYTIGTNTHSLPSNVSVSFTKIREGADAGKWWVTVQVLGIAGQEQQLNCTVRLDDSREITLQSDLSDDLSGFNSDKKTPLTLQGMVTIEVDVEAGFRATIKDWEKVTGGSGIAV